MDAKAATSYASETDCGATVVRQRPDKLSEWGPDDVLEFFREHELEEVGKKCKERKTTGSYLHDVTEEQMEEMGIGVDLAQRVLELLDMCKAQGKVCNDPIHGHIELHPLCVRIIDTPQFQRLRFIKQLGGCYFVFPGASHNRFEHSLGVAHLAGELVRQIRSKQPELGITDKDILCVEIAGLCHDLGHGPYSHLFDKLFIRKVQEKEQKEKKKWRHEDASVDMFKHLVEANEELAPMFKFYGLNKQDMTFIEEQIKGPRERVNKDPKTWPYSGRTLSKGFLYEVVGNKRNGVDVDKWDYFARDCHLLGIKNSFDHSRFIKFARVLEVERELQITSRFKEVENIYDMFHTRRRLHRQACHHKTTEIVEQMIAEVLLAANDCLEFKGKNGATVKMSGAIYDMEAYSKLTDQVIERIFYSDDDRLEKAKAIIKRIYKRDLYKCVGEAKSTSKEKLSDTDSKRFIEGICEADEEQQTLKEHLHLAIVTFDYGKGHDDPVKYMRFYHKANPSVAVQVTSEQVSQMLPKIFQEQIIRLYTRKTDRESVSTAARCFKKWCKKPESEMVCM